DNAIRTPPVCWAESETHGDSPTCSGDTPLFWWCRPPAISSDLTTPQGERTLPLRKQSTQPGPTGPARYGGRRLQERGTDDQGQARGQDRRHRAAPEIPSCHDHRGVLAVHYRCPEGGVVSL